MTALITVPSTSLPVPVSLGVTPFGMSRQQDVCFNTFFPFCFVHPETSLFPHFFLFSLSKEYKKKLLRKKLLQKERGFGKGYSNANMSVAFSLRLLCCHECWLSHLFHDITFSYWTTTTAPRFYFFNASNQIGECPIVLLINRC